MRTDRIILASAALAAVLLAGCSETRRLHAIQEMNYTASINLPGSRIDESAFQEITVPQVKQDTMTVNIDGHEMVIMKAVKDEETGEMVAAQELNAAVVTARFRNLAERHGRIDLEFQIRVPKELSFPAWQLRFYPDMYVMEDSIRLDNVVITGDAYRRTQLKGYQQYERFVNRIVSDSTKFVDVRNLDIFLKRNLPEIYAFKTDSTFVSDEEFSSCFGVTEREAIDHYTNHFSKKLNEKRKAKRDKMYRKYIKAPIVTDHIRLDTVINLENGDFIYNYVQTINTRKGLRKVDIVLSGEIFEQDKKIYTMPRTEPLTFYISSVSTFVDTTPRYLLKVIERKAEANASWNVDFKVGKTDIDEELGMNAVSLADIKRNILSLLENETFDLDSITIAAFASPEGSVHANRKLSEGRAKAAAAYFDSYVRMKQDSLRAEAGMVISVGDDMSESSMSVSMDDMPQEIRFRTSASGENWDYLTSIVENGEDFSEEEKECYRAALELPDLDLRENALKKSPDFYARLRKDSYPRLRTVQFNFYLHRRGMVKDTVHTTELDTVYMRGVQMLADRDYEGAAVLLGPYADYNTAIAYVSLDRNLSAMNILEKCEPTSQVNYMMALLHSRMGDERSAVEKYLTACKQDGAYVFRGQLDPEISVLIRKYNLNAEPEDEFQYDL